MHGSGTDKNVLCNKCRTPSITVNADCCEQASNKELYFLDTLLTVCIIHQLVVVHWRGVWEIFDVQVLPHDTNMSAIISLIVAYVLQALLCLVQAGANVLYRLQCSKIRRWALETFTFFIANLVAISHWRGVWLLLDCHFMPDNPGLSAGITHSVGIVVLWLMLCGHSVTASGCRVDGESPNEEGCLMPNYYVRLFVSRDSAAVNDTANVSVWAVSNPQININDERPVQF